MVSPNKRAGFYLCAKLLAVIGGTHNIHNVHANKHNSTDGEEPHTYCIHVNLIRINMYMCYAYTCTW